MPHRVMPKTAWTAPENASVASELRDLLNVLHDDVAIG